MIYYAHNYKGVLYNEKDLFVFGYYYYFYFFLYYSIRWSMAIRCARLVVCE